MSGSGTGGEEDGGDAAQAFEALREEVASLRRGLELVYRQGKEARSEITNVDYSLTLGQMTKTLQALQERMKEIEGKPLLKITPESYDKQMQNIGWTAAKVSMDALGRAATVQNEAALTYYKAARELQEMAQRVHTAREQRAWLTTIGMFGVVAGLLLWMILVSVLPWGGGTWLTALPLTGGDRWQAGIQLMQAGHPARYKEIMRLSKACGDQPVKFCAALIKADTALKAIEQPASNSQPPLELVPTRK